MSNYFDNQDRWSWTVTDESVLVKTDHGTHTHTLNLTDSKFGDLVENGGKTLGDAHRSVSHDPK